MPQDEADRGWRRVRRSRAVGSPVAEERDEQYGILDSVLQQAVRRHSIGPKQYYFVNIFTSVTEMLKWFRLKGCR
jgi:hypothetical protein